MDAISGAGLPVSSCPCLGLKPAFNIYFHAFVNEAFTCFGESLPGGYLKPFGFLLALASAFAVVDGKAEIGHGGAGRQVAHFGVSATLPISSILLRILLSVFLLGSRGFRMREPQLAWGCSPCWTTPRFLSWPLRLRFLPGTWRTCLSALYIRSRSSGAMPTYACMACSDGTSARGTCK